MSPPQARDPQLAVTQVSHALRFLPPGAILSFGIGNEPDIYRYVSVGIVTPRPYHCPTSLAVGAEPPQRSDDTVSRAFVNTRRGL